MRLTAGKIYFWGAVSIGVLTVWNRYSTRNLRVVVDGVKEERMREAQELRSYNEKHGIRVELTPEQKQRQKMSERGYPATFNPYHDQQQQENTDRKQ